MSEFVAPISLEVMVPFYGDVSHLMNAIESVINQTSTDWKMTVVDDGYPDRSTEKKISDLKDTRIRYIRNEVNLGANGNYKKCLALSSSELVILMGADDIMLPNYIQVVTDAYRMHPNASILHPGVDVIDEVGQQKFPLVDKIKRRYAPNSPNIQDLSGEALALSLIKGNWTYFPAICWRREELIKYNFRSGLNVTQDLALLIDQVLSGSHLIYIPTIAFQYRRHLGSDSSIKAVDGSRFKEESKLFRELAKEFDAYGWTKAARSARIHFSSRANALFSLPKALRVRNSTAAFSLLRHVFGK
jgi:glycosyltransferase involved in cell wall biosynthesis